MWFVCCLLLVCAAPTVWAQNTCDSSDGKCCDCSFVTCITHKGDNTNCKCTCYSLIVYCTSDGRCANNTCAQTPVRTTPEILAHIPWTTSPWIASQLAKNSTLPNPGLLYDVIINAELKTGPVGHSGVIGDPTQKSKYSIWWDLNDNSDTHQSRLRIWLDEAGVWQSTEDVEMSPVRLPIAETVNFYEDHWEQTTAKGTFSGKVEPFPSPAQARVDPLK